MTTKRLFLVVLLASAAMLALGITSTAIGAVNTRGAKSNRASVLASLLGPENRICCGNEYDQRSPAIAYNRNHREYMVVSYQA